jgi:cytochrome c oxidase assembly factor CtaG
MRNLPNILLVLALPAGLIGYTLAAQAMSAMALPKQTADFLILFIPLFVAGLFMLPFVIPFFDRMAKRDLAAHRRSIEADGEGQDGRKEPEEKPQGKG